MKEKCNETKLRNIIASVPGAVYRCANDAHWTMEFISHGIEELTGYPPSDFINNKVRSYASLIHPEDHPEVQRICSAAIAIQGTYDSYYRLLNKNGKHTWVHERGHGVYNEQGILLYLGGVIINVYSDYTERHRARELVEAKNKELEKFLYVASHDLRTPLVNIQGFSLRIEKLTQNIKSLLSQYEVDQELKQKLSTITDEQIPKALQYIFTGTAKMDTLIKGLLQISRIGKEDMNIQKVNMNELVGNIIKGTQFQLNETQSKIMVESLPECYGDKNLLNQLLTNIIENAVKYRARSRQLVINIASTVKNSKVIYSIKDNGIGIEDRHLEKIWDVFYRIDPQNSIAGDGIGLSVVKGIVDKHQGRIWIESKLGEGSTFYIELSQIPFTEI